ncbi:hypothetical protein [Yoonia sp. SS1-5]|uniref:Uncharacterized protein n=1 Tax=Yoonia rhodophyticola TaxID=3137370 RepID=A0AAN0MDD7_9RHOB
MAFQWDGLGSMLARFRAVMIDGELNICGAYTNSGGRKYSDLNREVMRQATIKMNGTRLLNDLRYFNVISNSQKDVYLEGSNAACRTTGIAATPEEIATVEIDVRSGTYRRR